MGCAKSEKADKVSSQLTTVYLQPYNDFTQQETEELCKVLKPKFEGLFTAKYTFQILPNKKFDKALMNDAKTRYRADKIIGALSKDASRRHIIIALTHKDVSLPYKGKADWGVLGLSIHGRYACVASTYRLRNKKRDFWKVVTHEFTHTAYKYSHCPDDNPRCIMKDAKGHADFSKKETFCKTCNNKINK